MSPLEGIDGIAIIGMAGRFPRARTIEELWRNLRDGVDCISDFSDDELEIPPPPELRGDPRFVKARGVLDEIDLFDAAFFDVPPRQAEAMDPQHRLFLETSWKALEDAGYEPQRYPGSIGVFGGVTLSSYFLRHLQTHPELFQTLGSYQVALGTDRDYLTTLVSYKLGLRGPSVDVQTACSTSLVAAVLACQSLLGYHCDMALAGGVSIKVPQQSGYLYQPGGLDSSDGRCRTFDARADGSVYGSGVGVVVLKRLDDALADGDAIHAVILGGAINNDGAARVGFTAPGVEGQAEVIANAQALAGVDPETIGYVECHGTGTALGDPIEVAALTRAFRAGGSRSRSFCALGSIKSNIGHCSAAAGVAGLIKATLAVRHRQIPPSLHFEKPNPGIDFTASPFYVSRTLADWTADHPLRAGVSSFGLGGTNAHLVLEEAPEPEPSSPSRPWQLLLLSARTETALETATGALAADLEAQPDRPFADIAFTAQVGRRAFASRRVLVCRDGDDARQALAARDPRRLLTAQREPGKRPVAFLFPGVGDHYTGMARGLYAAEPTFREHLDRICDLFKPRLGGDLREALRIEGVEEATTAGPDLRSLLGRATQAAPLGPHPPNPPLPSPSQPPGEGGMENLTLPKSPLSRAAGAGWERGLGGEGLNGAADLQLARTLHAQPAVFAVEIALAHLWMDWGVVPDALFGYSLGEYTAACLAGVLPLEDAVLLVAERARLLDSLPGGRMLAVPLSEAEITPRLAAAGLDLAAVNAPNVCVAAGPEDLVLAFRDTLTAEGIPSRLLTAEHAFHSRWMEPIAPALTRLARGLRLAPPKIPYLSDITGAWITPAEATDPGYWSRHLCRPVRFAAGLAMLWKDPARVLLEVGPGFGLSTLAMQSVGEDSATAERLALPSLRNEHDHQPDEAFLLGTLGKLWLAGVEIDWQGFWRHERRHRVRLPGYPFERSRFWIDPQPLDAPRAAQPSGETETISTALTGGDGFARARDRAPGRRLVLIEDDETARRIARLRELEALGAEVVVLTAAEAAAMSEMAAETPAPARSALPGRHARPRLANAYVAPESAAEIRIAGIFEELLGIAGVGAHDSFFDLGGHSLLATQVLARLRDRFGVELQLPEMFAEPTAAGLARCLQENQTDQTDPSDPSDPSDRSGPSRPVPVPRTGDLPLSSPQERLWFLDRLMPGNPFYNLAGGVLLNGPLQRAGLRAAFAALARRHEVLRTGFPEVAGRPLQRIEPEVEFALPLIDLSALPAAFRDPEAGRVAAERVRQPFDLARPPLLRGTLLRLSAEGTAHALLYAIHHIVADGWSLGILIREIAALYSAAPLPPLPLQYADFAVWQRGWMTGEVLARQLGYWRDHLAGAPVTEIPSDFSRPAIQTYRGATRRVSYPASRAAAVASAARRSGASPFMVLLAGFLAVLARWTGQEDLVVGTPVANRRHSEVEGLIGLFVNTLVLRTGLDGDPSVRALIERVKAVCLGAYAHQDLPFEQLVEELQPQRDLARNPLFQVMLNLLNTPLGRTGDGVLEAPKAPEDGLAMTPLTPGGGSALFDLQGYVTLGDEGIGIAWEYATDLYAAPTIERISRSFDAVLGALEAHPEARLSDLPLLGDGERHQIVAEWNDTSVGYPHGCCLHELFAAQAARTPNAVAAVYEDQQVTYRDLLDRSRRLAGHLARLGVEPDGRVGVLLERSLEMITGLLGVLQAGAAYVPLDPTLPAERLAALAASAGLSAVLVQDRYAGLLPPGGPPVVTVSTRTTRLDPAGPDGGVPACRRASEKNLAYVLYTSGSTGTPKGVMISHQGIVNRLLWMQEAYGLTAADRVLQKTPFSFDVSVWEFFWPLLTGASLVFAQPEGHKDPRYLADLIAREKITTVHFVPSMLDVFLETPGLEALTSLRRVVASGEALPPRLVRRFFSRLPHAPIAIELHNLYGPTEASVDVSFWPCVPEPPRDLVPIGRPIANHHLHVVDRALAPQPIGIPGELLLGGPGLARGYLDRPDLTAAVFIPDPFGAAPGERLYRTGDLVRRLADGTVHYLGRIDHQVKIRGFRIELGEVEAALARLPGVREAVVLMREDETGDKRLAAYVASSTEPAPAPEDLRTALRRTLPEAMVPADFVILESLPISANGKVDRRALAKIAPVAMGSLVKTAARFMAPQGPFEEVLAQIWSEVLGVARRGLERIGARDDFFVLGGHSLLATQVMSRVRDAFGVELPLRALFEAPTVTALAARIDSERRGPQAPTPPIVPVPRDRDLPLSFAQQRLWFLDRLAPDNPFYNVSGAVRLTGALDVDALRRAFREIVRRHETLRTTFRGGDEDPVQVIASAPPVPPAPDVEVPLIDLEGLAPDLVRHELSRLSGDESRRPFHLARGPLLRAGLLRAAGREHTLLVSLHHIISDGWSMGILFYELATLYGAFSQGAPSPLPELPLQYADFAVWQRGWMTGEVLARQLGYWRDHLAGAPVTEVPSDFPRPALQTFRGATRRVFYPASIAAAVGSLAQRSGASPFMVLLAGFLAVLARWTGQDDLVVGTPVANRQHSEVEGLIGLFVNTLVLRTDLDGDPSVRALIERVKTVCLGAYAHQDLPFEQLVEELQPQRDLARNPLFQVVLNLFSAPMSPTGPIGQAGDGHPEGGLTMTPLTPGGGSSLFDLQGYVTHGDQGIGIAWEYATNLYAATTIERISHSFAAVLGALAAHPEARLSDLPLLNEAERHQLTEWNDTGESPGDRCLHELFAAQAAIQPSAPAIFAADGTVLTYRELDDRSSRVARSLLRRGIRPGDRVAVLAERSPSIAVATLGILKAGAAYLPLDPAHPAERRALLTADAGASLLLTSESLACTDPTDPTDPADPANQTDAVLPAISPDALAYVIYTSGSTGMPKGVMISHRQAVNTLLDVNRRFAVGPADRIFAVSSLAFDLSVWDLFGAFAAGAAAVLPPPAVQPDPAAWADRMASTGVTIWNSAPALLEMLVESGASLPPTLRLAMLSGDWIPLSLPGRVRRQVPGIRLISLGGATEGSIWSILQPIGVVDPAWRSIPYGRPMLAQRFHVLGRRGLPSPTGVPGELCIGGAGVAMGYLARPDLTAERFVPDPFGPPGSRLYRTGDLGRHQPYPADGTLEILGRLDFQVKIRGFRIELGEIEAALTAHPDVREAVAAAPLTTAGERRLVAYIVPEAGRAPDPAALRAALASRLPEPMVPAQIVTLERLPLTANGKVDRRALPAPEAPPRILVPPRDPVEERLAALWQRLLGLAAVSVHDNFFDIGGHSLLATRLTAAIREEMDVEIPVREIFEHPVLADQALAVAGYQAKAVDETELSQMLQDLDELSDEDVERLLAAESEAE